MLSTRVKLVGQTESLAALAATMTGAVGHSKSSADKNGSSSIQTSLRTEVGAD